MKLEKRTPSLEEMGVRNQVDFARAVWTIARSTEDDIFFLQGPPCPGVEKGWRVGYQNKDISPHLLGVAICIGIELEGKYHMYLRKGIGYDIAQKKRGYIPLLVWPAIKPTMHQAVQREESITRESNLCIERLVEKPNGASNGNL